MRHLHARYPFLAAAREAVATEAVDLATVVEQDRAVVDRAHERVASALENGDVGEPRGDPRTELLSYPVARVLVSAVEERILVRKYARAEATVAHERFRDDLEDTTELKSVETDDVDLATLLAEFDLTDSVRPISASASARGGGSASASAGSGSAGGESVAGGQPAAGGSIGDPTEYRIDVGAYLPLAADCWSDEWRLVNRALGDGAVPVTETELLTLLGEAVRERVEDGLPFDVPAPIADALADEVESIRERLSELELTREIDTVVPDLFPPCMKALLDDIQKGEHLPHHSRFAITAFLTSIGMETDEIVDLYRVNSSFGADMTRYQTDHIRGDTSPTEYSPPSCATMQSYGDCVNKDDRCETIPHPMAYYEDVLDETDDEDLEDWRESRADEEAAAESED